MVAAPVVVVCGNAARRASYLAALVGAGWVHAVAVDALAAVVGLVRERADACVIVDAEVADVSGLNAVRVLKGFQPQLKVVFAAPEENALELETQVRALNVLYYYVNTGDPAELVAAVTDAIGPPPRRHRGQALTVLVVDDDPDIHELIRLVLAPAGYRLVSAYCEKDGLDLARQERPDIILIDIIMESATAGFEFCHEARRDPLLKHTPLIGISALKDWLDEHGLSTRDPDLFPVDVFLGKPLVAQQLLAELRRLLPQEG